MLPNRSVLDATNRGFGHAKESGNGFALHATSKQLTDFHYVGIGELFASPFTFRIPALCNHVVNIIGMCTQKQMGRIAAGGIIAAVTDNHVFWNRAVVNLIGKSVRSVFRLAVSHPAVSKFIASQRPFPTFIWLAWGNVFVKEVFKRAVTTTIVTANVFHGFALDHACVTVSVGGHGRFISATATAVSIWNFLGNRARGMICHVEKLLSAFGQAQDVCRVAGHFVLGFTPSLYHEETINAQ